MDDLRNILPTGMSNAISARELAAKIGVSDRVLRDIVTEDRVKGIVICSSSAGYYLPANKMKSESFVILWKKEQNIHLLQYRAHAGHWEKLRGSRHLFPKNQVSKQKEANT